MAKTKNKKRVSADKVHNKKELRNSKKSMNPFEVHINKEKMSVLGRKTKNDRGLPGVSRAKALKKRKHTLLQEYKHQNKSNRFVDKRIGERSKDMTQDDKITARFAAVRMKAHKKSIFNLADDDFTLTHKGQTLSEIEKFDDPRSEDEDEEDSGRLEAGFVKTAHFGGGILSNTGNDGAKTHKELIDQLISESKKRKAEQQKTKEATLELTEKLDTDWKDLLPLVNKINKKNEITEKPPIDDYDKTMRELRFEARGTVSDRLKSEEEVAREEKEKLEELERERRMRANENVPKLAHRSADDLDDDFVYESDPEYMLSYNQEGEANVHIDGQVNSKKINEKDNGQEEGESSEEEDEEEEELETESEDDLSDLKSNSSEESENEDFKEKSDENDCNEAEAENEEVIEAEDNEDLESNSEDSGDEDVAATKSDDDTKTNLSRHEIMEKARKELPYTFTLPNSYEELQQLFEGHSVAHQSVIIERMIKCNHPSLNEGNKENLGVLFVYLLQHLNDSAAEARDFASTKNCFDVFAALAPHIFDLAQLNPDNAHNSIREVIREKQEEFRKKPRSYPGIEVLIFLKLVSLLFSTSDFRHQIVTPCFVFIEQMLTKCRVRTKRDISYGLFLATIVLEYTTLSQRFLPAVVNYLGGILHMAIPKSGVKLIKVNPPFVAISNQLSLYENCSNEIVDLKLHVTDLFNQEIDESFKIRAIHTTLKLIGDFENNFANLSSNVEIFGEIANYLKLLPVSNYQLSVQKQCTNLSEQLEARKAARKLDFLVMAAQRPKALRLYEPKIVPVFDGKKYKVQSREKAERDKLMYKLKKEKKGAMREIRRDKAFLGRIKVQQRIKSDNERREKVKRIYSEAAMQQGELNSMERKKTRK